MDKYSTIYQDSAGNDKEKTNKVNRQLLINCLNSSTLSVSLKFGKIFVIKSLYTSLIDLLVLFVISTACALSTSDR